MKPLRHFGPIFAILVLCLSACSDDETPVDTGGTDTAIPDDASDAGDGVSDDTDNTADVDESDGGEPDVIEPSDVATDTPPRDASEPVCRFDADCPEGRVCDSGQCVQFCVRDSECDDLNICTSNACVDSRCVTDVITPAPTIADDAAGDCRRPTCIDGELITFPDRNDLPNDDGIACTLESCRGTFPVWDPSNEFCDDGDDNNGVEVCSVAAGGCTLGDQPTWYCEPVLVAWDANETCGDGQDNDGDGLADEDCGCEFGDVQRCFTGPIDARRVGGCLDGYQRCENRTRPRWGACEGQVVPAEEICDLKDNDCNECVDDLADCNPLLSCPSEDFARPLREYALDAAAILDVDELEIGDVQWTVIAPANSATVGADDPTAASTSVYLDVSGDYQISLEVDTDKGTLGCSWVVHVAGSGLRVEMRWDTFGSVDMDLHLHRAGTSTNFCTDDDCYYANCRTYSTGLPWGYDDSPSTECEVTFGTCNNPRLDIDNISGNQPENINIDNPNHGDTFRIMAHKFSGTATTNPIISVYCGGRLRTVLGEAPDQVGLTRSGSGCQGHTWRAADVTMIVDPDTGFTDCNVEVLTGEYSGWDVRLNSSAY